MDRGQNNQYYYLRHFPIVCDLPTNKRNYFFVFFVSFSPLPEKQTAFQWQMPSPGLFFLYSNNRNECVYVAIVCVVIYMSSPD